MSNVEQVFVAAKRIWSSQAGRVFIGGQKAHVDKVLSELTSWQYLQHLINDLNNKDVVQFTKKLKDGGEVVFHREKKLNWFQIAAEQCRFTWNKWTGKFKNPFKVPEEKLKQANINRMKEDMPHQVDETRTTLQAEDAAKPVEPTSVAANANPVETVPVKPGVESVPTQLVEPPTQALLEPQQIEEILEDAVPTAKLSLEELKRFNTEQAAKFLENKAEIIEGYITQNVPKSFRPAFRQFLKQSFEEVNYSKIKPETLNSKLYLNSHLKKSLLQIVRIPVGTTHLLDKTQQAVPVNIVYTPFTETRNGFFRFLNPEGKQLGWMELFPKTEEKALYIEEMHNRSSLKGMGTKMHQLAIELSQKAGFEGKVTFLATDSSQMFHYRQGYRYIEYPNLNTQLEEALKNGARDLGRQSNDGTAMMHLPEETLAAKLKEFAQKPLLTADAETLMLPKPTA